MNFALFDVMTTAEAREHLAGFLETERVVVKALEASARAVGIVMAYSLPSLSPSLKWIIQGMQIVRVPVDPNDASWVREYYKDGFVEFTDDSKLLLLRAAYYMGECFVRSSSTLRWDVGDPEFAEKNMPVIAGFLHRMQLAPMMVCENIASRILRGAGTEQAVDTMVEAWIGLIPRDTPRHDS